jgi:CPA2 family monovalent cation:H+ antiporter-2
LHISPALGAFVAGLLLGESPFAAQVQADIGSLKIMMVTLFFASIGMLLKPLWFMMNLHWIVLMAILIFLLKSAIIFMVARLFGLDNRHALATGITLAQIGEFSFVLLGVARNGGIIGEYHFNMIISVIILLMFTAPYMVSFAFPLTDRILALFSSYFPVPEKASTASGKTPFSGVLVIGLGPAGREVVQSLLAHKLTPSVIDINPQSRLTGNQLGITVHLGDAGREEVLHRADLDTICMVVVTVPDPQSAIRIIRGVRRMMPYLPIAARCRYHRHLEDVKAAGADIIVDEETSTGNLLSNEVL